MILGMDWLSRNQVVVDCRMKRVTLRTTSVEEVTFIGKRLNDEPKSHLFLVHFSVLISVIFE